VPASSTSSPASTMRSWRFTLRARSAAWSPGYVQQHAATPGFCGGRHSRTHGAAGQRTGSAAGAGPGLRHPGRLADDPDQSAIRESPEPGCAPGPRAEQPFVRLREGRQRTGRGHGRRDHRRQRPPHPFRWPGRHRPARAVAPPRPPLLRAGRRSARRRVRPRLFQELQALEARTPSCARRFAHPARRRRGAGRLCQPVRHAVPMLSIRTETDTEASGAQAFDARVRRELGLAMPTRRSNTWPSPSSTAWP
jgi:hypothetical protein